MCFISRSPLIQTLKSMCICRDYKTTNLRICRVLHDTHIYWKYQTIYLYIYNLSTVEIYVLVPKRNVFQTAVHNSSLPPSSPAPIKSPSVTSAKNSLITGISNALIVSLICRRFVSSSSGSSCSMSLLYRSVSSWLSIRPVIRDATLSIAANVSISMTLNLPSMLTLRRRNPLTLTSGMMDS